MKRRWGNPAASTDVLSQYFGSATDSLNASASPMTFTLTGSDMTDFDAGVIGGRRVVLNIFPSIDTGTCAMSVRRFNQLAADLDHTLVLCVSADLPFAGGRFCGAEGIENAKVGSTFRSSFGADYGVTMTDGNPPTVENLTMLVDGNALAVSTTPVKSGSASVKVDGKTYTITGEAQGADLKNPLSGQITKPFTIKVSCG